MPFTSYSDWVGANAGNEADVTARALSKAQEGNDPNAVGNALKAGQSGQPQPTSTYGDFLKSLQGDPSSAAGALGGGATSFDAMLMQGGQGDQLKQAQQAYDQQQAGANAAYASGQKNANADQSGYLAAQQKAGYGIQGNSAAAQQMRADQLKAGKDAQQASRDAGAQYRLAKERAGFEADRKSRGDIERGVSDVLNPIGGLADMAGEWNRGFGGNNGTVFGKGAALVQDPFGLGGNAHSGFGPGGKFGSPGGMGDASQGDPFGQYSQDDAGFTAWLKKNGYDPTTGNGGGY